MARPAGAAGGAGGQHYAQEYPYQRALDKTGQEKLEKSWEKLSVNLKDKFKVWVKSCLPPDDDMPPQCVQLARPYVARRHRALTPVRPRPASRPYCVPVTPATSIDDIMDMIRVQERRQADEAPEMSDVDDDFVLERRLRLASEREARFKGDAPLKLIYAGKVLRPGTRFGDYNWKGEVWKWSHPYVGVIWISPYHVEPGFSKGKYF